MSSVTIPSTHTSTRRWRRPAGFALALALVGVVGWQVWVHVSAWNALKEGRAALARDDPESARPHLARCLETWPQSAEANFLAAQAARRCGDLSAAEKHLKVAAQFGYGADDIEVEYALIKAESGHFAEAESALLHHLQNGHREGPQILEVIVPVYMAQFQWSKVDALGAKWIELRPESAKAWKTYAEIQERLRKTNAAVDALRRVVELAPEDRKARLDLARLLLETRQSPDEAAKHAEWAVQADPRDATALVQLAACREAQSRTEEAIAILDRVIAEFPPNSTAYHIRGRMELSRNAEAALPFLRRAAELDRSNPDVLYSLFLCLQRAGTPEQAAEAEKQWRRSFDDLRRARELGRLISASPHDPELRREMGELFLRNGRDAEGLRWLESALRENPAHIPTHRVLAEYYDRIGQPERAGYHRSFLLGRVNGKQP